MKLPVQQKGIYCCQSERERWITTRRQFALPFSLHLSNPHPLIFLTTETWRVCIGSVLTHFFSVLWCFHWAHEWCALFWWDSPVGTCGTTDLRRGSHAHEPDSAFFWHHVLSTTSLWSVIAARFTSKCSYSFFFPLHTFCIGEPVSFIQPLFPVTKMIKVVPAVRYLQCLSHTYRYSPSNKCCWSYAPCYVLTQQARIYCSLDLESCGRNRFKLP